LGYKTDALLSWFSIHLINQLTAPGYSPYLVSSYRIATVRSADSHYFETWSELKSAYKSSYDPVAVFNYNLDDPEHGYAYIALCAASMIYDQPNGAQAWLWIRDMVLSNSRLNQNPKWAITPRNTGSIKLQAPTRLKAVISKP
jgi:hypothetical protein